MTDFNTLSTVPFGWLKLTLYYVTSIVIFLLIRKVKVFFTRKRNLFLELLYLILILIIGSSYLIIFAYGEKFYIGSLFIEKGNDDLIRYSSLFFMIILSVYYSPNIRKGFMD